MTRAWKAWTRNEERRLEEFQLEGKTNVEIMAILGRSLKSVEDRIHRIGVKKSANCPYLDMIYQGVPPREIAARLGVKIARIAQIKYRLRKAGMGEAEMPRLKAGRPKKQGDAA